MWSQKPIEIPIGEWLVRSWTSTDEVALAKYANNRKLWLNLRDSFPYPYTRDDARAWLRHTRQHSTDLFLAIATRDEAIGGIGLHRKNDVYRMSAEIGYWLGEPFWGRGIATRAVIAVTQYGFDHLSLLRIFAAVFAWNPASARVLEKAGYTLEGRKRHGVVKDGQVIDELMYSITREDWGR